MTGSEVGVGHKASTWGPTESAAGGRGGLLYEGEFGARLTGVPLVCRAGAGSAQRRSQSFGAIYIHSSKSFDLYDPAQSPVVLAFACRSPGSVGPGTRTDFREGLG